MRVERAGAIFRPGSQRPTFRGSGMELRGADSGFHRAEGPSGLLRRQHRRLPRWTEKWCSPTAARFTAAGSPRKSKVPSRATRESRAHGPFRTGSTCRDGRRPCGVLLGGALTVRCTLGTLWPVVPRPGRHAEAAARGPFREMTRALNHFSMPTTRKIATARPSTNPHASIRIASV